MAHSQSGGHRNKADRREDIEQNLAYELSRFSQKSGKHISFNKEARERFLTFALDPDNRWPGNFSDLNAMVVRMATPSDGRRSPALLYRLWVPSNSLFHSSSSQGMGTPSRVKKSAPHLSIACTIGTVALPRPVKAYSVLGGTTG